MKLPPPSRSVAAAKKAVSSGGKSLVDEDTGSTIGESSSLVVVDRQHLSAEVLSHEHTSSA